MHVLREVFFHGQGEETPLDLPLNQLIWVEPIFGLDKEQLEEALRELNYEQEPLLLFLNPVDSDIIQGFILINQRLGVFDQELKDFIHSSQEKTVQRSLKPDYTDKSVRSLQHAFQTMQRQAAVKFEEARHHSSSLRDLFQDQLNEALMEELKQRLVDHLQEPEQDVPETLSMLDSYYGAFTSKGPRYFTYPLPDSIKKWIILKGHAEKDISNLLMDLKEWADEHHHTYKLYRCPLHEHEIDRLEFPGLQVGFIDGNSYHPFEPVYPKDKVIDLDTYLNYRDTFYYFAPEIRELEARYRQKMRQGTLYLQEAGQDLRALINLFEPIHLIDMLQD